MGNTIQKIERQHRRRSSKKRSGGNNAALNTQAFLIDACTTLFNQPNVSFDRDNESDDESLYTKEGDESTLDESYKYGGRKSKSKDHRRGGSSKRYDDDESTFDDGSLVSGSLKGTSHQRGRAGIGDDYSASSSTLVSDLKKQPLASSFAKRCHFTKAGIGKTTPHYEGLTLTGQVVLMLPNAMKLKGCPTICDEDLRRVEQMFPNQFSRLPDELLLSSGWRRISKYCHFSNKPLPDGVPFFHSRDRLKNGNYYFLLAAAVGMNRPSEVEPLSRDTLVLLETDFPNQCDQLPGKLLSDPTQWLLIDKFCFFSGGPIHDEDVYYRANLDGNSVYMLAFLSPSLGPEELYRLHSSPAEQLHSIQAVHEVESVYNLTERDFDDLKLYHLGPCRALPSYLLNPQHWQKILPKEFLRCRTLALERASQIEGVPIPAPNADVAMNMHVDKPAHLSQMPYHQTMPLNQQIHSQQLYQSGYSQLPYPPTPGSVLSDPNTNLVQHQHMNSGFPPQMQIPTMQSQISAKPDLSAQQMSQSAFVNLQPLPRIPEPFESRDPMLPKNTPLQMDEPPSLSNHYNSHNLPTPQGLQQIPGDDSQDPTPMDEQNYYSKPPTGASTVRNTLATNMPLQSDKHQQQLNSEYNATTYRTNLPVNDNPGLGTIPTMSDVTSVISAGSSVWTETDPSSRTARRAMIIKMAKERMKAVQKDDPNSESKKFTNTGDIDLSRDLD